MIALEYITAGSGPLDGYLRMISPALIALLDPQLKRQVGFGSQVSIKHCPDEKHRLFVYMHGS